MTNYSINTAWYNEIKHLAIFENAHIVAEGPFSGQVEVDVMDVEKFEKVSTELGWM